MTANPLLRVQFRVPFDQIRPEHVEPAIAELLADARTDLQAIVDTPGPRTFDNTLGALEAATERLEFAMTVVGHLESVATTPELRAAHNAVQGPVAEFFAQIPLDAGLWRVLQEFSRTPEAAALTGARKRLLERTLDDFRRQGAELDPAGKARLAELSAELAQITTQFSEHVLDGTNAYELWLTDPADLAGLPQSAIDAARASAEAKGRPGAWRFTLQQPSFVPFVTYADSPKLREELWRAANICAADGPHDNRELLRRILLLRREQAELLGFRDFADFVLKPRMAKDGASARAFVDRLAARTEAAFAAEARDLHAFRRRLEGPDAPEPAPWDLAYYAEKQRRALYDFDDEALRPYFPVESVLSGLFALVHDLYGVRVEPVDDVETWHPDVRTYAVRDGGALLGVFYADLFPREQKRSGAWMNALVTGRPDGRGGLGPHLGLICGNLTPPLGDRPALLTHDEVETIFHEFGHLLHAIFGGGQRWSGIAGTRVEWDFVETPSMLLQQWASNAQVLTQFAKHHQTGEPIPEELVTKLRASKEFGKGLWSRRQLFLSALSLDYYSRKPGFDTTQALAAQQKKLSPFKHEHRDGTHFELAFGHLDGYSAAYYTYLWSSVIAKDLESEFEKHGYLDRDTAMKYRRTVLEPGGSKPAAALVKDFLGRDYGFQAYEKWLNQKPEASGTVPASK